MPLVFIISMVCAFHKKKNLIYLINISAFFSVCHENKIFIKHDKFIVYKCECACLCVCAHTDYVSIWHLIVSFIIGNFSQALISTTETVPSEIFVHFLILSFIELMRVAGVFFLCYTVCSFSESDQLSLCSQWVCSWLVEYVTYRESINPFPHFRQLLHKSC